jgi:hypothetical protein
MPSMKSLKLIGEFIVLAIITPTLIYVAVSISSKTGVIVTIFLAVLDIVDIIAIVNSFKNP